MLKLSSVTNLINALKSVSAQALLATGITEWSFEVDVKPAITGVDDTKGAYFTSEGLLQQIIEDSGVWVDAGDPIITERYVQTSGVFNGILGVDDTTALFALTLPNDTLRLVTQDATRANRGVWQADDTEQNGWKQVLRQFVSELDPEDETDGLNGKAVAGYAGAAVESEQNSSYSNKKAWVNGEESKFAVQDSAGQVIGYITIDDIYKHLIDQEGAFNRLTLNEQASNRYPNVWAITDVNGKVIFQFSEDKLFVPNLTMPDGYHLQRDVWKDYLPTSLPTIYCYGDSLTDGGQGVGGDDYPSLLEAIFASRNVYNFGIGSQTSEQIVARFGGNPCTFSAENDQINAAGTTNLYASNIDLLLNSGNQEIKGWYAGVYGVLRRAGGLLAPSFGDYTFEPLKILDAALLIEEDSLFVPDTKIHKQSTVIIWTGRNDVNSVGDKLADVVEFNTQNMIDACLALKVNYIVISILNATSEDNQSANYTNIYNANDRLRQRHGNRFFDALSFLPKNADGTIEATYMADVVHLNDAGYAIVANKLYKHIKNNRY